MHWLYSFQVLWQYITEYSGIHVKQNDFDLSYRQQCTWWGFSGLLYHRLVLIDFSLTLKAATLIFISGRGSAISFAKEGKSGFIYNLVKS